MYIDVDAGMADHINEVCFVDRLERHWDKSLAYFRMRTGHFGGRDEAKTRLGEILDLPYLTEPQARGTGYGFFLDVHVSEPTNQDAVVVVGPDPLILDQKLQALHLALGVS